MSKFDMNELMKKTKLSNYHVKKKQLDVQNQKTDIKIDMDLRQQEFWIEWFDKKSSELGWLHDEFENHEECID